MIWGSPLSWKAPCAANQRRSLELFGDQMGSIMIAKGSGWSFQLHVCFSNVQRCSNMRVCVYIYIYVYNMTMPEWRAYFVRVDTTNQIWPKDPEKLALPCFAHVCWFWKMILLDVSALKENQWGRQLAPAGRRYNVECLVFKSFLDDKQQA